MVTLAAIRTNRWDDDVRRMIACLEPVFGHNLSIIYHNRDFDIQPDVPVIDINDAWVAGHGLRVVPDWGWRCGDYFHYAHRLARPDGQFYWLFEPDVFFHGDATDFFSLVSADFSDAIGAWYGPPQTKHMFLAGVTDKPQMHAVFPVTRLSGLALDWLFTERTAYSASRIKDHVFTNDEMFVFSWIASHPEFTVRALNEIVPEWFVGTHFQTNPDIVLNAVLASTGKGLFHPVRAAESFGREVGRKIVSTQRFRKILEPSLGHLGDEDATRIAASIEIELKAMFRSAMDKAR